MIIAIRTVCLSSKCPDEIGKLLLHYQGIMSPHLPYSMIMTMIVGKKRFPRRLVLDTLLWLLVVPIVLIKIVGIAPVSTRIECAYLMMGTKLWWLQMCRKMPLHPLLLLRMIMIVLLLMSYMPTSCPQLLQMPEQVLMSMKMIMSIELMYWNYLAIPPSLRVVRSTSQ